MAWSAPPTAAAGDTFTASMWNTGVRDNLNATAVGIATTAGRIIVTSGTNAVAERVVAQTVNDTAGTTTSTSYTTTLSGGGTSPAVTVTTGTAVMVFLNSAVANSASNSTACSYSISGATTFNTQGNQDSVAIIMDGGSGKDDRFGISNLHQGINAGSNTITMVYRVSGSTGTYTKRRLQVMAL